MYSKSFLLFSSLVLVLGLAGNASAVCDPAAAWNPDPFDGETDVIGPSGQEAHPILIWSAGEGANSHEVYLGTNFDDVNDANTSTPGIWRCHNTKTDLDYIPDEPLEFLQSYYWRIDENRTGGKPTVKSIVWHFSMGEPPLQPQCFKYSGDLNEDCIVDLEDLGLFTKQWLDAGGCWEPNCADLDGVNGVNMVDLAMLAENWLIPPSPLYGSFGTIDQRYERDQIPETDNSVVWSGTAWRGERLSAQIVVWTSSGANDVYFSSTPLYGEDGNEIAASCAQAAFVHYVLSDDGSQGCGNTNFHRTPLLVADVLDTVQQVDIPANSTQPVWISLNIPSDANPGQYQGRVIVSADDSSSLTFEIKVEVLPLLLPEPSQWGFHLDLWQNPWSVARYHNVGPWSSEHWLLLEPLLRMLAKAGQKCITTTIIHEPWGGQTYDPYGSMIEWTKHTDSSWTYDYTAFDQYVEFCDSVGITEQINCYSMVPWTNDFRYFDEAAGDYVILHALPGTADYENHWAAFLQDFRVHLSQKGWLNRTAIAMDERDLSSMEAVINLLKAHAPELKIAMAGHYYSSINSNIYDLCIYVGHIGSSTPDVIAARKLQELVTTFYVCCSNARPNNFTYSPPAENTWMGWYAASMDFDGFLRWAYNSWVEDPLVDTRHVTYQAGDCFLVYPGARSSIRFERLRDGIQDYEKVRILSGILQGSDLQQLQDILGTFTYPQSEPCAEVVGSAKEQLVQLSRKAIQ